MNHALISVNTKLYEFALELQFPVTVPFNILFLFRLASILTQNLRIFVNQFSNQFKVFFCMLRCCSKKQLSTSFFFRCHVEIRNQKKSSISARFHRFYCRRLSLQME